MRQKEEDEKARWIAEGHARMGEVLRRSADLVTLSDDVIKNLVKITGANQGSVFIANDQNPKDVFLELTACYAYDRKKHERKTIYPGNGQVGQCFLERDTIVLTQVPNHYVKITSGLGEGTPSFIVIIPIKTNDTIEGVMEIASFRIMPDYHVAFLEKVCQGFAAVIRAVKVNEATRALLETSQNQTEELRAQEEEMRQNMEELAATQEAMERKTIEADEHSHMLKAIFDSSADAILTTDEQGIIDTHNKAAMAMFQYSGEELAGTTMTRLLAEVEHGEFSHQAEATLGQLVTTEGLKKDGTRFPIEWMVNEAYVGDRRIFTCIIHDITHRAKAESLKQAQLEAFKMQEEELRLNKEELYASRQIKERFDNRETLLDLTSILSETDLRGVITYANAKFCEVAKYKAGELIGKPQSIVRHPDMPKELFRLMWETIRQGHVFSGIIKNKAKDGTAYWVDATIVPIKDRDGKVMKYIGARYHIKNETTALEQYNRQADHFGWPRLLGHELVPL
ncbi:MAG: PAS domain S-box protein [Bacteroidetes bacterium]|nr:PAS domain S-box protein [Bacteroidota bacterium]